MDSYHLQLFVDLLQFSFLKLSDYDCRLLTEDPIYLGEIGNHLQLLNLEYCKKHIPHLFEKGGKHVIRIIAESLINNELEIALQIRLQEADKIRACKEPSEYITKIFGTGFRVLTAYQRNRQIPQL